ncbi:MAG TPA: MotA/TolQ/ExbB proton channel family protein [Bacteroidales bacterium]|nr:MotA/TolQ/ExbB proton channel family protein [Bacteroidales bacterium]
MINYSFENIKNSFFIITEMIGVKSVDLRTDMELMKMFSRKVRMEGLLSLDDDIKHIEDQYLKNGFQLAVDGFKIDSLDEILKDEIKAKERSLSMSVKVLDSMAEYGPAYGMIGTVIGMILMLQHISNPKALGAGLSVALITTLYGSMFSNMIIGPLAGKLEYLSKLDLNRKQMFRVGILSMINGENPQIMEKKMLIHLDPESRAEYIKYHEELERSRDRDKKIYNQWIEYQNKKWKTLNESLAKVTG